MSEMRQDLLTGEWIIFASNRQQRPYDFEKRSVPKKQEGNCQFCPGNEELTPGALFQNGEDGKWSIRVFKNKYPAVSEEAEPFFQEEFYKNRLGDGLHYVIVDTPEHTRAIHHFTKEHMAALLEVLQKMVETMKKKESVRYIQVFKNKGPDAGASILHSHWQMIGMPVVPKDQSDAFRSSQRYFEEEGRCIYCDILQKELADGRRMIEENSQFAAFTPYASKMSYEIWIMPKLHVPTYTSLGKGQLSDLGEILLHSLERVSQIREDMSYNICFMDRPLSRDGDGHCHFYIRIIPRIGSFAGFEFATGSYINPVFPEDAAQMYRKLDLFH